MRSAVGRKRVLREVAIVLFQALLLAGFVRTFLFQSFNIPSESMTPTLLIGDHLFVSKFSYGYNRYSFPLDMLPFSGRFFARSPELGDVVVFRLPTDPSVDYIKRIVGTPGDRVQIKMGRLFINGVPVRRELVSDPLSGSELKLASNSNHDVRRVASNRKDKKDTSKLFKETLPNGISYLTFQSEGASPPDGEARILFTVNHDNTIEYLVPEGHYFMLGDNRNNSQDSRFLGLVGYVPAENLIGKAQVLFYSADTLGAKTWLGAFWITITQPWRVRYSRFFTKL